MAIRRHLWVAVKVLLQFIGKSIFYLIFVVMMSPILLLMAMCYAALISVLLPFGGCFLLLAWITALILEHFIGGPFWLWMILTGTGTTLFLISLVSGWCKEDRVKPTTGNSTMLAAGALVATGVLCNNQDSEGIIGDRVETGYKGY